MVCIRRAWLTLGDRRLELEDEIAGYYCTELDLGYPEVREVMTNRPDNNGADDRTAYFGARAVAASVRARAGGTMTPDEIGTLFAPWMLPNVRPELHYVLDRAGEPERVAIVRASGYTWPISGAHTREIHLGWIAADPAMWDPAGRVAVARAGSSTVPGRVYPLRFPRAYPAAGGASSTGLISSPGDIPVRPLFRIYGPVTAPRVDLQLAGTGPGGTGVLHITFVAGFIIDAGHYVDFDADARTALADGDPARPVMDQIDWQETVFPMLPTEPRFTYMNLYGGTTSAVTQVEAMWKDGYLT